MPYYHRVRRGDDVIQQSLIGISGHSLLSHTENNTSDAFSKMTVAAAVTEAYLCGKIDRRRERLGNMRQAVRDRVSAQTKEVFDIVEDETGRQMSDGGESGYAMVHTLPENLGPMVSEIIDALLDIPEEIRVRIFDVLTRAYTAGWNDEIDRQGSDMAKSN